MCGSPAVPSLNGIHGEPEETMGTYVIVRRGGWAEPDQLEQAVARSITESHRMSGDFRCIRSYLLAESNGDLGTICICEARNPEAIRRHASMAALPVDEIVEVADTVILGADPVTR